MCSEQGLALLRKPFQIGMRIAGNLRSDI